MTSAIQAMKPLHYTPARIDITTKSPELRMDWDAVWEELGVLKISTQARELSAKAQREASDAIGEESRNGRRIRDIHKEKGNIYGKIAFEKYLKSHEVNVEMKALPRLGVKIDVKVYPPKIKVTTKEVGQ